MGAQNVVIKQDSTSFAITGGTDQTFTPDGVAIPNGLHLADAATADFRVRPSVTLKTRNPQYNTGTGFTKGKRWASLTCPITLASGETAYNVFRVEVEIHPESTVAQEKDVRMRGAQLLFDADLDSFWTSGSLA